MPSNLKCADVDALLADFLDGSLQSSDTAAVQLHLAHCRECAELAEDARAGSQFLKEASQEIVLPPALVRQILEATSSRPVEGFWSKLLGLSLPGLLQPRWVMSFAMAALSVVMVGRFWGAAESSAYRAWDRTIKRYDNLALVENVQSQIDDWRSQFGPLPEADGAARK